MNVLDLAQKRGIELRKASGTHGGEWHGPCPACGGTDRFHVWPEQNGGRGGYWCRGCELTGDDIQFLRDFEGLSFRDACARLGVTVPQRPDSRRPGQAREARPAFQPERRVPPADLWQEKAHKFIDWAETNLAQDQAALAWLAGRGICVETARRYRLGMNVGDAGRDLYRPRKAWGLPDLQRDDGRPRALCIPRGLVIPYVVDSIVYRIRIRRPEAHRTEAWPAPYYVLPGSSMATMIVGRERRAFAVVESELDAIAVAEAGKTAGAIGLGSAAAKPDAEAFGLLEGALQILNALDYDRAGAKSMAWWNATFDHCDRWPVPKGKDPGDAVRLGIDLDSWIKAGLPPALTIESGCRTPRPLEARSETIAPGNETIAPGNETKPATGETTTPDPDIPAAVRELLDLLRKNPSVRIINEPGHYTVLRDGKWVGGRISELVFRSPEVVDYIALNPAAEISAANLVC